MAELIPKIHFYDFRVININWNIPSEEKSATEKIGAHLHLHVYFDNDNTSKFTVEFESELKNTEEVTVATIKAKCYFLCDQPIADDMKEHPIFSVNAPAIAYPYLRSFISNLSLNSNYNLIILPVFSFLKEVKKPDDFKKSE